MANLNKVTGLKRVLRNMEKAKDIDVASVQAGLKAGGLVLQGLSQRLVPVDNGILKASAFTRASSGFERMTVHVGYTAEYAPYVHEAPMKLKGQKRKGKDAKGKYWDPIPRGSNKFLERPMRENRKEIAETVVSVAKANQYKKSSLK